MSRLFNAFVAAGLVLAGGTLMYLESRSSATPGVGFALAMMCFVGVAWFVDLPPGKVQWMRDRLPSREQVGYVAVTLLCAFTIGLIARPLVDLLPSFPVRELSFTFGGVVCGARHFRFGRREDML